VKPTSERSIAAVIIVNLVLFLAVVTLPAFQAAHHHWIFPVLAVLFAAQWGLTFIPSSIDRSALRASVVSMLVFLLIMGIARHATILACFDRCSFKLAAAAALAGCVFLGQAWTRDDGFWNPLRASLAATAAWLWALSLVLRGLNLAPWLSDLFFAILALLFWLGRDRAVFLITAIGIALALAVRATANEYAIIGLSVIWSVALPLWAAPRVEAWLAKRRGGPAPARKDDGPLGRKILMSAARIAAAVAVIAGIFRFVAGPISLVTDPGKRRAYLAARAPASPVRDPKTLSPLAARLRAHVVMLARTIGERDAYDPKGRTRARDYAFSRLKVAGYEPKLLPYESRAMGSVKNGARYDNVEAVLRVRAPEPRGAWVIGAHYDSAPGTPGADDNASGVAVLLETARLLRMRKLGREVRFVAFGTEEPPSFGTRNMGSWHYGSGLKDNGVRVHGMISLEMLGFYNTRPGSQLYPPFLQLFYPDRGDFVGVVGNLESRILLGAFGAAWRRASSFPLTTSILPGPFAGLALSDQLNFWALGFPALMLSDTAFYRNANYHQATDLPETLDYERMAEVTTALAAAVED